MGRIFVLMCLLFVGRAFSEDVNTKPQIEGVKESWTKKDVGGILANINKWEELDSSDPALWLVKIYYYAYLAPDKQHALNACQKLKDLGVSYNSSELIALANEKKKSIESIPDCTVTVLA